MFGNVVFLVSRPSYYRNTLKSDGIKTLTCCALISQTFVYRLLTEMHLPNVWIPSPVWWRISETAKNKTQNTQRFKCYQMPHVVHITVPGSLIPWLPSRAINLSHVHLKLSVVLAPVTCLSDAFHLHCPVREAVFVPFLTINEFIHFIHNIWAF